MDEPGKASERCRLPLPPPFGCLRATIGGQCGRIRTFMDARILGRLWPEARGGGKGRSWFFPFRCIVQSGAERMRIAIWKSWTKDSPASLCYILRAKSAGVCLDGVCLKRGGRGSKKWSGKRRVVIRAVGPGRETGARSSDGSFPGSPPASPTGNRKVAPRLDVYASGNFPSEGSQPLGPG